MFSTNITVMVCGKLKGRKIMLVLKDMLLNKNGHEK